VTDPQTQEREVTASAKVGKLEADVSRLMAALKRAEEQRNRYANQVLEAEEREHESMEREIALTDRIQFQDFVMAAARELIGSNWTQGRWAELVADMKAKHEAVEF
jgi:nitroreductase